MRLRFEDCVLDTDRRRLTRGGHDVPIAPKAFRLLEFLAERRPRAVSRSELREVLWPDTPAGGTTLARLISEVRAALEDQDRPPRFIRTLHRFGYAFCAEADEEPAAPPPARSGCAIQWGPRLVTLASGENVIGRAADAAINIALDRVSRRHARIVVEGGRAVLEDLGSKHGTLLGERRVEGPVELKHGDLIGIGPVLLVYRDITRDESTF